MLFHNKPIHRMLASEIDANHRNDDALGRALDTLYEYGVTERYRLIAATAARRLGLTPTVVHLDSTSFHIDGRYNGGEEPDSHVIHITHGYSRDHLPDLHPSHTGPDGGASASQPPLRPRKCPWPKSTLPRWRR